MARSERHDDDDDDDYLDLDTLARYSKLSVRTLRRYLTDPVRPLPHLHVRTGGKGKGRVLVRKRAFDRWMEQFAVGGGRGGRDDPTDVSWIPKVY